jgi:hypothetical protein
MITTLNTRKLTMFAGICLLAALALVLPMDAFASTTVDVAKQSKTLAAQAVNLPKLIAVGAYVIGAFFAVRCLFALKGFVEAPDDNPITKVISFGAIAALLILLPYIIGLLRNTMGLEQDNQVDSSAQFTNDTESDFD